MSFQLASEKSFAENIAHLGARRLEKCLVKLSVLTAAGSSADTGPVADAHPVGGASIDAASAGVPAAEGRTAVDDSAAAAIHGARKEVKKVRALLRLARHALGSHVFERENTALRDAGRALSATRDAQVLVKVFDQIEPATHADGRIAAATTARLRARLAGEAAATADRANLVSAATRAAGILARVHVGIPGWGLGSGGWRLLAPGLRAVYRAGRRGLAAAASVSARDGEDAAVWHEWRKQVKHLAYQMRLLRPIWPEVICKFGRELESLAELLGDEHDLSVLQKKLAGAGAEAPDESTAPAAHADADGKSSPPVPWIDSPGERTAFDVLIAARREALQRQALEIGRRLYQEKPARLSRRLKGYWRAWREEHPAEACSVPPRAADRA